MREIPCSEPQYLFRGRVKAQNMTSTATSRRMRPVQAKIAETAVTLAPNSNRALTSAKDTSCTGSEGTTPWGLDELPSERGRRRSTRGRDRKGSLRLTGPRGSKGTEHLPGPFALGGTQ